VPFATLPWHDATKSAALHDMPRTSLTSFVTFAALAALSMAAVAHPLEEAAREAVQLCQRVDATSLEHCGTEMAGRSPEHTAARRSVGKVFAARNAFMRFCQDEPRRSCSEQADWHIGAGMARALNAPILQSSTQR
jgi:hypothetical protein